MVVRIVHGQAGSLYSALLKGQAEANSPQQSREVQAKAAAPSGAVAQQQATSSSDAVKVTLSGQQSAQSLTQLVRASSLGEAVVTSVRSGRSLAGGERIEQYKEARQVTDDLSRKMHDEPEKSMEAHDVDKLSSGPSR